MYPHEGSVYNWTHRALGPYWSFFAGICYWLPCPLVIVSAIDIIIGYIQGLNTTWLVAPWQQGVTIIVVTAISGLIAAQRTRVVQNLVNTGACCALFATLLIGVAAVVWLLSGHASRTNFLQSSNWSINPQNFGLFGLITLAYLGVQVPLNMAGEVKGIGEREGNRAIGGHLAWGTVLVIVGYFTATFALLVVQGAANIATPFALVSTVDLVFGKIAGNIVVICIMFFFLTSAIGYNMSFTRLVLVGSIDRRLPIFAGKLNRHRVPVNAVILQTATAIFFAALLFLVVPYLFSAGAPENLATEVVNIALAAVVIIWAFLTIFFFIDLFMLYRRDRENFERRRIFPMPLLWISMILGPVGSLVTIAGAVRYSWINTLIPDTTWLLIVGSLVLLCIVFASIGSMFATSQAHWEGLHE